MATPSHTPPGKCGCTGGIVVSCGSVKMEESVPVNKSKRRLVQVAKSRCPLCEDPSREFRRIGTIDYRKCDDVKRKRKPATDDVNDENAQFGGAAARRSYASLFRNALYKWNERRRKNRRATTADVESTVYTGNQHQNISEVISKSSANKVSQDLTPMSENPREVSQPLVVAQGPDHRNFYHGEVRRRESRDKSSRGPWGVSRAQISTKRNATATAGKRDEFDRNGRMLPRSSVLGDDGNEIRKANFSNDRQRRGNYRKRMSSPNHRKESNRETIPQQSTYVSFQDDFTQDIFLNMTSKDLTPRSSTTLGYVSKRTNQSNASNNSTSKTNANSITTSPSDDVFLENYVAGNYQMDQTQAGSNEDIANERIATLFQAVKSAFEKETPKSETGEVRHCASMEPNNNYHGKRTMFNFDNTVVENRTVVERNESHMLHRQYQVPYNRALTMSDTRGGHQPIESIMNSANLQASLENAMRMLQESSKLLIPGQGLHHAYVRHGAQQQARARTYSTCSRLETIAEENDRGEEGGTDFIKSPNDTTWYCYTDSSHQDKSSSRCLRVDTNNCQPDCDDSFSSGLCRPQHSFGALNRPVYRGDRRQLNDSEHKINIHMKRLQQHSYATKPRSVSTSTISVKNIHKEGQTFASATNSDNCAACDWLRHGKRQFPVTTATVVSNTDWRSILNENGYCQDMSHTQSWGLCTKKHTQPVLCHTHYLQYYQYLQTKPRPVIRRRRPTLSSASSQSDSVIDYDIKEILSSLDNFTMSDRSSANSSVGNRHSANYCRSMNEIDGCESHYCSSVAAQFTGIGQHAVHKRSSDTDVSSVNSDSAFSTNGSLTPSTRDGVITDRDSLDSTTENNIEHHFQMYSQSPQAKRSKAYCKTISFKENKNGQSQGYDQSGKKESIEKQAKRNCKLHRVSGVESNSNQRCSIISFTGSSPVTLETLGDSAVHLQDNCSSYSTHLSSDSFYSSRTSFEKENYYSGSVISLAISQSSSEASLNSEGTLCLSDYMFSQQNLTLQAGSSSILNEQFETEITPCLSPDKQKSVSKSDSFAQWVSEASTNECNLEKLMDSELCAEETRKQPKIKFPNSNSLRLENSAAGGQKETSSSGSSDSNTLDSVSSRSTYATSTLSSNRTQSRYNTFDSSPCVSTDDTGDTVIDQYMLRCQEESAQSVNKMRYQPSAFHYENLDIPDQSSLQFQLHEVRAKHAPRNVCLFKSLNNMSEITPDESQIIVPRSRSASLSCVVTSVTKVFCIMGQSKSVPCIHRSSFCELQTCVKSGKEDIEKRRYSRRPKANSVGLSKKLQSHNLYAHTPVISSNYNHILHSKVNSMLQNCCQTETMITSLRESVNSCSNSSAALLDKKLLELDNILKQKDELINQLHNLLLFASKTKKINIGYPLGTM